MELFEKFGINLSVLIAQAVNFLIVLAVLYKFAYRPILKLLHDRQQRIDKSLKEADEIHAKLKEAEDQRQNMIAKTKREADHLIERAMKEATDRQKEILEQTRKETHAIAERAKSELRLAKSTLLKEAYSDIADLIIDVTEKVMKEKFTDEAQRERIMEIIASVSTEKH